ncbi:TIGR04222 domain-containing membrane protein [Lentzea tibetensis]|uniref:TIGR04222 domain-containing membrane protein n=1 Tax=Lentzea tibetensis TaxID=2591470 RepID=UPI00164862F6|nr:TIGR04222 domain-containing membrane protein [Lentzea tibetensis]
MERPWGLSGPEFLELYWIALAALVVFAIIVRVRARSGNSQPVRTLDLDELAYLAGGPRRVVEASLARLLAAEALRTSRRGAVQVTGVPVVNPVDQAVVEDAQRYTNRTIYLLVPKVAEHHAVTSIGTRLVEAGLVIDRDEVRSRLRRGALPLWVLLAVGIARWFNGITIDAPVGWLTLQLVVTGLLIFIVTRRGKLMRTSKGDRVLQEARASGTTGGVTSPASVEYAGAAGLVALGGLAAYPDLTVRSSLLAAPAGGTTGYVGGSCGASTSSCSSGGGSSSCCGGGGCGGGCGGGGG